MSAFFHKITWLGSHQVFFQAHVLELCEFDGAVLCSACTFDFNSYVLTSC